MTKQPEHDQVEHPTRDFSPIPPWLSNIGNRRGRRAIMKR